MNKFLSKFLDKTFLKFMICGVINTLFGTGINFLCLNLFHWSVWLSSGADYLLGSILSYFLNKYFTFKSKGSTVKTAIKFAVNIVICYIVSNLLAQLCAWWFMDSLEHMVRENLKALTGLCIFVAINYFSQRFWVFKND